MNRTSLLIIIVAGFIPTFLFPGCIKDPVTKSDTAIYPDGVAILDSANFASKVAVPGLIAMVDFFSPVCDSCKKFDDTIKVLAKRYSDPSKVLIGKVNSYHKNDSLYNSFVDWIGEFPNLLFFNGGKVVKSKHGVMRVESCAKIIDSLLASVAH